MAVPNNNENKYPTGERNDGGVVDNRALAGSGVRNDAGLIENLKWLDVDGLLLNQRVPPPRLQV